MNRLIFDGAIGDTIGITASLKKLYEVEGRKIDLYTKFPEIFHNNPYVSSSNLLNPLADTNLSPCKKYNCNIVKYYASQLNLEYDDSFRVKIFLTEEEIAGAKIELNEFEGCKKVAVCLYSSADSRDLRYELVVDTLRSLKQEGVKLIFFGTKMPEDKENLFDKVVLGEYAVGLRRVFSLMNECDMYFGVDTGLFHAAEALDIPQVAFFRNNGCENNAYANTRFIYSKIECPHDCHTPCLVTCISNERCMDNFDMLEYEKIAKEVLGL